MRMRRQQRVALGQRDEGGRPREGRSFYQQLSEDRPHDEPPSSARGSADAMEHSASIYGGKKRQVDSNSALIFAGQPLLAVHFRPSQTERNSQEWLSTRG